MLLVAALYIETKMLLYITLFCEQLQFFFVEFRSFHLSIFLNDPNIVKTADASRPVNITR